MHDPVTALDSRFSSEGASATSWAEARGQLESAAVFWLTTVRPDGRPHVTPLLAVWLDNTICFSTGAEERKAKNLAHNTSCVLTTGCNTLADGLDLVIEGDATVVRDAAALRSIAGTYEAKYGERFTAPDGTWSGLGDAIRSGNALIYRVTPTAVFGFGKGVQFNQTRWRFPQRAAQG